MRISEKTIEINFCAEIATQYSSTHRIVWFGLTQKEEAKAGFDACARTDTLLSIFQFKASNKFAKGARRFSTAHRQLLALRRLPRNDRGVYYVFPSFGESREFAKLKSIVSSCQYADLEDFPKRIARPTKTQGTLRANGKHNIYVYSGHAEFHSTPFTVPLRKATDFLPPDEDTFYPPSDSIDTTVGHPRVKPRKPFPENGIPATEFGGAEKFWSYVEGLGRSAYGMAATRLEEK